MSKIYKATIYYVDNENQIDDTNSFDHEVKTLFERSGLGRLDLITDIVQSKEFEWIDDIDINTSQPNEKTFGKYFNGQTEVSIGDLIRTFNTSEMHIEFDTINQYENGTTDDYSENTYTIYLVDNKTNEPISGGVSIGSFNSADIAFAYKILSGLLIRREEEQNELLFEQNEGNFDSSGTWVEEPSR